MIKGKHNRQEPPVGYSGSSFQATTDLGALIAETVGDNTPYRSRDFSFTVCLAGGLDEIANMHSKHVGAGTIDYAGVGSLVRYTGIEPGSRLCAFMVTPEVLGELMGDKAPVIFHHYAYDASSRISEAQCMAFQSLVQSLVMLMAVSDEEDPAVKSLLFTLLSFSSSLFKDVDFVSRGSSRELQIVNGFLRLLNVSKGRKRKISDYSSELCISDHHLSVTIKKICGVTVKDLIDRMTIAEIKMMLKYGDMSISQISEELEFPNTSFMCNFFKKNVGVSPLKYRSSHAE